MLVAEAFVSWGKWVASCPHPDCPAGERYGLRDDGLPGGLRTDSFHCSYCGTVCAAKWPEHAAGIERLLALRPLPCNRNWLPGEGLDDLLAENIEHGILPPGLGEAGRLVVTATEVIEGAALLPGIRRLSIERAEV